MAFEWLASLRHHIDSSSYMCGEKHCARADAIALPPNLRLTPSLDAEATGAELLAAAGLESSCARVHLHARLEAVRVHSLEHSFAYDAEYAGLAPAYCAHVAGHEASGVGVRPLSAPLSLTFSDRALFALAHALSGLRLGLLQGSFVETIQTLALVLETIE